MTSSLAEIRTEYRGEELDEAAVDPDPIAQFAVWFAEAERAEVPEVNAMTLATVDEHGRPRARIVLLKRADHRGFVFFTNYRSDKARQCEASGFASLTFFWPPLARQVRVDGAVHRISDDESRAYFAARPRQSQIGAHASPQSRPVSNRGELEAAFDAAEARFDDEVPCPEHWGGFVVVPDRVEFWQGRPARLHDRIEYLHADGIWIVRRLAP